MSLVEKIDLQRVPRHIAIIMDGNGRWAKERNLDRSQGHRKGLDIVHEITNDAADLGVECLTLYAFSTENWNRPQAEVDALMALVVYGIERETPGMIENGVRLSVVKTALEKVRGKNFEVLCETIKKTAFKVTRVGQLVAQEASKKLNVPFGIVDLSLAPTPAIGDSVADILCCLRKRMDC